MGFQRWNTDGDVEDQYETFNGMPVYYGGELYDSDWDDPFSLASAAYEEDYNFDVPEGMDLMVHRHGRIPDSADVQQDCQMDVAPVYHTVSYATQDEWDTSDNDSLTATADDDDPYIWTTSTNEWYRRTTRITLIRTTGPLRILMDQCRRENIVLFRTMVPWRT